MSSRRARQPNAEARSPSPFQRSTENAGLPSDQPFGMFYSFRTVCSLRGCPNDSPDAI